MNELATIPELLPERIEAIEAKLLGLEQMNCPVTHHFGGGICIREVTLPAGMLAIGHHHKTAHMNFMVRGRATFLLPNGATEEYVAPRVSLWPPGRKIAIIHEDMIWQNIFPTTETDPVKLENELLEKSDSFLNDQRQRGAIEHFQREVDRQDFHKAIAELHFSEIEVRRISEDESDLIPFPQVEQPVVVSPSPIEGQGLFATRNFEIGDAIAPARFLNQRTPAGRFTNHSATPNARMVDTGDMVFLMAVRPISGYRGGQPGEEITVDYRESAKISMNKEELCQP